MFAFPDWLSEYQVQDNFFADAYESTEPYLRAWLKKTIAQVYGINSPDSPQKKWTVNTWRGGFETEISQAPLDWTVMLIDRDSVSAVRVLAALAPVFAADVKNVLVVFVGEGDIRPSVLAGFELAGQEDVVRIDSSQLIELMDFLGQSPFTGAVIDMRPKAENFSCPPAVKYWRGPCISSICVCKDEDSPDMDVLEFAHPDVEFIEVDEDDLSEIHADAAVVPAEVVGDALLSFRIVLAHGQEGCWVWNGFGRSFFQQESIALAVVD